MTRRTRDWRESTFTGGDNFLNRKRTTPLAMVTRLRRNLLFRLYTFRASLSLRQETETSHSAEEWFDLASTFHRRVNIPEIARAALSIAPTQIKEEMIALMHLVGQARPHRILEIGTSNGGTLFLFARVAAHDARIIGIDLPRKRYATGIPKWRLPLYGAFASGRQKVQMLTQDSHSRATLAKVKAIVGDQELDFLFIDGDHSYAGVASDFRMYSPLVRRGGIIAFHDVVPDYKTRYGKETINYAGGVHLFWGTLRTERMSQEIIRDPAQDGFGIGVLINE